MRALVRGDRGPIPGVDAFIAGDLDDEEALRRLVQGADLIVHCAGLVKARSAAEFFRVNRDGAARLATVARTEAGDTAFVLASSLAAIRPTISPYAASKAEAEAAVRAELAGGRAAILRPPAVYGPNDAATKPLFDAIRAGIAPVLGPASARFAMIYVDDAARAALAAGRAATAEAPVFEIDDGAGGHSWADVRRAAEAAAGKRLVRAPVPGAVIRALGAAGSLVAATGLAAPFLTAGKAREMLAGDWLAAPERALPDWAPEVSLQSGFSRTLACYRERRRKNM